MRGNTFGKLFSITSFGESHGHSIGVVVDGVPSLLTFDQSKLQIALNKRRPGKIKGTTTRNELDKAIVLSGIVDNVTLGTPICVIVNNTNQKSEDYNNIKNRIGHADQTTLDKYKIKDKRGGGRSSGRETIARVIGGYFADLVLPKEIKVKAISKSIGEIHDTNKFNSIVKTDEYGFRDTFKNNAKDYLINLQKCGDSVGGSIIIIIENCTKGLGEPSFDKLKADFAKALMSIGAITSFSYGLGEGFSKLKGSVATKDKANFGGIEGGISNGETIILNVTVKPTSTVGKKALEGRHDPCIVPRVIPVLEAMVKITLADHYLRQKAYD